MPSLQAFCHAEKLFRLIDLDGDGKLTETEFLKVKGEYTQTLDEQ